LIILCKGVKIPNGIKKCDFLYSGTWGDSALIEHQKFHQSLENNNYLWLGFDTPQSFGHYSGRDGKRS